MSALSKDSVRTMMGEVLAGPGQAAAARRRHAADRHRLPVAGLLRARPAGRGRGRHRAELRRPRPPVDRDRRRRARLPRAAAAGVTSGSPGPRLPAARRNTLVTRGYRGTWARASPLPGLPPVGGGPRRRSRQAPPRAAWEHALTARETLVVGAGRVDQEQAEELRAGGLRPGRPPPASSLRPTSSAPAEGRLWLMTSGSTGRPKRVAHTLAEPRRPSPRTSRPALAVPLRPRRLRVVAGRHPVPRPPRPGRRVRRAGRARRLARPGPGRGRDRRIGHPDVLAPGAPRGR